MVHAMQAYHDDDLMGATRIMTKSPAVLYPHPRDWMEYCKYVLLANIQFVARNHHDAIVLWSTVTMSAVHRGVAAKREQRWQRRPNV